MAVVGAGERSLVLRLEFVVELLQDALPKLRGNRLRVQPRRQHPRQSHEDAGVGHVRLECVGDSGVLDLDRHGRAVVEARPVDLPDRRRGERLLLDRGEDALGTLAVLLLENLHNALPRHRRGVGAELRELLLVDLPILGRQEVDVDE